MSESRKCFMCETEEGKPHPVTGKPIEDFVVNNRGTAQICSECLTRSAAIMAADKQASTDFATQGVAEPLVYSEEHILATQRIAKNRLAEEARAHQQKAKDTKDS
jgi:hypothetical protein